MRDHRSDLLIAVLAMLLMALGLLVVFAVGPRVAQFENSNSGSQFSDSYFFTHHLISVVMSVVLLAVAFSCV